MSLDVQNDPVIQEEIAKKRAARQNYVDRIAKRDKMVIVRDLLFSHFATGRASSCVGPFCANSLPEDARTNSCRERSERAAGEAIRSQWQDSRRVRRSCSSEESEGGAANDDNVESETSANGTLTHVGIPRVS